MPKTKTDTAAQTEVEEQVRYLSPPEYVKAANARDHREKHSVDLHHFIDFYMERQGHQKVSPWTVDEIIADYLDAVEPKQ